MNTDYNPIDFNDYLNECSEHMLMLSLPGLAYVCHRDIEGFASGRCIIRPKIENSFYNDLVPDYHYISVDFNVKTPFHEAVEKIEKRFKEVINDQDYLRSVAQNAIDWYDKNVSIANVYKFTADLLDFNN